VILDTISQRRDLLARSRTVAMVGASANVTRPSYFVFSYLRTKGLLDVTPINPALREIDGVRAYPSLEAYAAERGAPDIVDVFRKPADALAVTRDAIAAEQDLAAGRMETFSIEEVRAYSAAPTPLAFWRSWRHVPAAELARAAKISEEYLAELEAGQAVADVATYVRLARRLRTHVESLIREEAPTAAGAEAAE